MPLILCKLPNASTRINGVEFKPTDAGMLSGDVSAEVAEAFAKIPGYEIVQAQGKRKAAAKAGEEEAQGGDAPEAPTEA